MKSVNSARGGFTRIIIDSQSNPHFLGVQSEQRFDQRAGLAQGRRGDVVVTTDPIDPKYIEYWSRLKFTLPTLITAGPFMQTKVLSQLILDKPEVQEKIRSSINGLSPRLEFFTPSDSEETLARHLELPTYVNFNFSKEMQKKSVFKKLCEKIGVSTLPYVPLSPGISWEQVIEILGESREGYIAKHIYGTGGAGLGTIVPLRSKAEFCNLNGNENYIIEKMIAVEMEISVHWEIDFDGTVHFINRFEQLAENVSYVGTIFPVEIPENLWTLIFNEYKILTQKISELKGLGFMCCDIIVDENGKFYWSDLNPRKGAILFVYDAVCRFLKNHNLSNEPYFVRHKHIKSKVHSFTELESLLGQRLILAKNGIIIVTNPGVIEHGMVDLTALSFLGHEHASFLLQDVENLVRA